MKDEFKIITREEKTFENGLKEIIAIEFREPAMIKFESGEPLKDGELLEVRGSYVYHNGIQIGKIKIMKSANDVKASHNFDIKYTGGYSLDGTTIFLDEHFPEEIEVENKKINTMLTIGYHHEPWMIFKKFKKSLTNQTGTSQHPNTELIHSKTSDSPFSKVFFSLVIILNSSFIKSHLLGELKFYLYIDEFINYRITCNHKL